MTRTPEQEELAATVRSLLAKRSDSAAVRVAMESPVGHDASLWQLLCEQVGVAALPIPEEAGGAGFSLAEALVVAEEIGYALAPLPLVSSLIASAALITTPGTESLLERIAGGEVATLASATTTSASTDVDEPLTYVDGRVSGTIEYVLDGDIATVLIAAARTGDGVALVSVDPADVARTQTPAMDPTLRLANLTFDDAPATLVVDDASEALSRAHDAGCLTVAALQVGAARRGLDMTVAYAKERVQFGRPIGSFQALKHRMADMLVRVEMARSAVDAATTDPTMIHSAAAYCSDALSHIGAETIQLHGGIGITWEHDAHLVFKRAHALGQLFGQPHEHRALISL
ncbi:acyl-CoA dehydrogenase [Nocardioides baekrokdamisoli]|uniref:Acyl-CoA dehydrogenase n=1 Tax=Nocardioides baekrokdamisoli TaxID=1804624 RepID=A0A3G9J602_9ACTN|nr:acyl-CoA dehydrogenase family protein [Nocardioides baekrokdamisoli]BBH18439.1 acyl-CoA dehydrogenase [Nocardioides baekrokdamisoli]